MMSIMAGKLGFNPNAEEDANKEQEEREKAEKLEAEERKKALMQKL